MKAKTYILIAILSLLTLLSAYLYIDRQRDNERHIAAIGLMHTADSIRTVSYEATINGLKVQVSESQSLLLTEREAKLAGLIDRDRYKSLYLKEISHVVDLTAQIKILSDSLANTDAEIIYLTPKYLDLQADSTRALKLPFTFWEKNEYLNLKGGFKLNGQMYYALSMQLELDLTIGIKKRTNTPTVSAFSTSPYVGDIRIRSIEVVENNHFWNTTLFKGAVGFAFGSYVTYKIVK